MNIISPLLMEKNEVWVQKAACKHTVGINSARELDHQRWKDKGGDTITHFPSGERVHSPVQAEESES